MMLLKRAVYRLNAAPAGRLLSPIRRRCRPASYRATSQRSLIGRDVSSQKGHGYFLSSCANSGCVLLTAVPIKVVWRFDVGGRGIARALRRWDLGDVGCASWHNCSARIACGVSRGVRFFTNPQFRLLLLWAMHDDPGPRRAALVPA